MSMSVYGNACLVHGRIDMFFISCTSSLCLFFLLVFFAVFFSIAFCLHNFHYTTSTLIIEILNYVVPNRSVLLFFSISSKHSVFCRFLSYKCSVASLNICCSWWASVMIRFSFILLNYYYIFIFLYLYC